MAWNHFRTRAELDRQIEAARQLRAERLDGTGWIAGALTLAFRWLGGLIRRLATADLRRSA
jgi:hypothetical protein